MKLTEKFNEMTFDWKKALPYAVALVVFIGIALLYCSPMLNGKVLQAGDVNNWKGAANEAIEYKLTTGDTPFWTNSMFGGMPTYQVTGSMPSGELRSSVEKCFHFGFSSDLASIGLITAYFFGFFLMLLCFGINPWISIIGGLAIGLSSYFFIIIPAGHMTKAAALGFLAPMIGGFYAIMRRKYWLGIPLMVVYGFLGITLHPQMTYYIFLLLGVMGIAELYIYIRANEWKRLGLNLGILALCMGLIFVTKLSWWQQNNEYLGDTMRGGHSELTQNTTKTDSQAATGLSFQYATDWSYGIDETLTLLIPNTMGGASGYNVGDHSSLFKGLTRMGVPKTEAKKFCKQAPTYWGEKPFTSGAVYVGAVVFFLFILGLIIVPGPYKWALFFATLMSILLAWGKHLPGLSHFFFDYFPMYNKFRAVESILVVAEITMPLLGFMGLQRIMEGKVDWKKLKLSLLITGGVLAIICFIFAAFSGSIFDFTSSYDNAWKGQVGDKVYRMIVDQRQAMLSADAWRSLIFVVLGCGLVYGYAWLQRSFGNKLYYKIGFLTILAGIILADMIPVDKRFFGDDNYVSKKEGDAYFKIQPWEEEILEDKDPNYRVFNLAVNTFNDSRTSYRLKSIGGYSAAKLRRYQDLIDEHISKMNWKVINMLNTRYIIHPQYGVMPNPDAMGNVWFVDNVQFVPTPDDECNALNTLDLHTTAVADEKFREVLTCDNTPNAVGEIALLSYEPNRLIYTASTECDRVAVFSEIYYPHGWHLLIDGQEARIGRVNYVLRAAVIPAGEHTIEMKFVPSALPVDKWSYICSILLLAISLGLITFPLWKRFLPDKTK